MANNGIYYSSGNTLNFTTNNTTWATLTSGGTFVMNTVSGGTYLNLPSATFTGGTVTGPTNFTSGLTANTISATTYLNLPVSAVTNGTGISASTSNGAVTITNTAPDQTVTISGGTGITTGGTYPNFTLVNSAPDQTVTITGGTNMQIVGTYPNFGVNFTGTTGSNFTGGTVSGATNFTGGLTANTISATTYYNLPYSGTVNGVGTTNYVSKWTDSTALGDSQIYDDGTFVGIGTTAKTYNEVLNVYGNGGIFNNTVNFVGHSSASIAIADGDYSNWESGGSEIAIGGGQPLLNSQGAYNIAIGYNALPDNTFGFDNVAIGNTSLNVNTTGLENIAVGHGTLSSNQAGQGNVSLGYHAGSGITSGSYNVFLGYKAGGNETTGDNRLFIANTYEKTLIYGEFDNNKVGINTTTPIAALDVSGGTRIEGSLTANTISATTYYNLPVTADTYVTGFTLSSNTITLRQNRSDSYSAFTISLSAYTGGTSGAYLPLSGGTLTGGLVANSGVTASTISQTSYIDFTTGSTNPSSVGGRVFFDTTQKALSYFDITNNQVPIAMGQQLYTRVWNATGTQIDKGKVIAITGTSNNLPSAILAVNTHSITSARPIGLAAENIPNGSEGLVLNNGILSGITLNTFANGDTLYLSDTVPGGYVSSTSSLAFTARTNEIGYVLQTGSTTGKIYVNINNEDSNLSLTDKERNILEGNVISGGVYEYTGMTQGTGNTINVALVRGWIVKNTYSFATLPDVTNVYYSGGTNITITNLATADATFILINSASTLVQQTTFPTPQQRRENILLGKVVHPTRTSITSLNQTVDFDVSPMAALRDLWTPLKLINQGVIVSYYSAGTMSIQTSAGALWGNGIGWTTNQQNPDSISISGTSPTTFQYRSRLGPITGSTGLPAAPTGNTTTIDSHHYDLNGSIVAVGANNRATNQRIYLFPTGLIRIQYGQFSYSSMANAIAGIDTEIFVEYSNNRDNGILIGILTVREDATDLSLTTDAQFRFVSKFGELLAGAGGISTTTLQQAYDNSATPEILINSTLDGLSIKNGTGNADNVTSLLQGLNTAGVTTSFIRADGAFSGTSIFGAGLTATTISATTYQNLPSFNFVKITGTTQFSAGTNNYLNFSGINMTITSGSNNTLIFSAGTGSGGGVTSLTASDGISGNTTTGAVSVVNTDKGSSQNIFKNIKIAGTTQFSAGSNSSDLNFSGVNITITSASTNTLVFSASTGGGISGSGTTNYIPKWTGSTGLGKSQLQDDGSQVFISDVGVVYSAKVSIATSAYTIGLYSRATQYGIYGGLSGLTVGAAGVYGEATKGQYGVFGLNQGDNSGTYVGVYGAAQQANDAFAGAIYIGGKFYGDPITNAGYSVQLQDGSEGLNKVLVSATSDGKANWSNTLTGLTNVRSTTISAATYQGNVVTQITAGSNISINQSTGNVTISSTGGGGGTSLGTVYTTANNFNFL
jgi:hypothetical protein